MEREDFQARHIDRVMKMKGCKAYADYSTLSILPDKQPKERTAYKDALLKLHGELFGKESAPDKIENFIRENFRREWFLLKSQYEIQLEEETFLHKRMASFFVGKKVLESNVSYQVTLDKEIDFIQSKNLRGMVHAITKEEDGHPNAIIFKTTKPVYKWRSKSVATKISNAPELLAAYIGLREKFGENLQVSIVYLKSEKENPERSFDFKNQIVSADFCKETVPDLRERMYNVLTYNPEKDCEGCQYAALCKGELRTSTEGKGEKSSGAVRTPTFTESQQQVVNFGNGACAVYAVPGAGKTTTLVYRLCKMIESGIDAKSIMFVTFTKKAAAEIKERVKRILGTESEADLPDIFTYNGLGWQIIRDHPEIVGEKKLLSPLDEKLMLLDVIDKTGEKLVGYNYNYIQGKQGMLNILQKSFRGLLKDEERETASLAKTGKDSEQVKNLLLHWLEEIKKNNYINYDEQVTLAVQILQQNPDILATYGSRWNYIMADEFQDSSQDNVDLLYMLADAGGGNLVVVGDADQSIFEWRDGSPKHLLNFGKHFPAKKIVMQDNFRSAEQILTASNKLIAHNNDRISISMKGHIKGTTLPYRVKNAEIESVLKILELLRNSRFQPESIAILARKNSALIKCKKILEQAGIESISPSDLLINDLFFIMVKDLLSLYVDGFESNDMAFFRLCTLFGAALPKKENPAETFYQNLIKESHIKPIDIHDMDSMLEYSVLDESRQTDDIYMAARKIHQCFLEAQADKPEWFVEHATEIIGYDKEDPAVRALLSVIDQHEPMESIEQLKDYMETMVEIGDETMVEHGSVPGKINLMTAHGAKGKEFPAVIVLQSEDFAATEEERRLMYVAMTRAKKVLFTLESPYETCEIFDEIEDYLQTITLN